MNQSAAPFSDPEVTSFLRITTIEKNTSVYLEIYRRLRHLIKSGVLKYGDMLPSEYALSAIMCVGRTSLRTALSLLYEDGYIRTTRGKGSYVTGDLRKEKYRRKFPSGMILAPERIELLGTMTKSHAVYHKVGDDGFLIEKLSPPPGIDIMLYEQLYFLNGEPAILASYYFLSNLFPNSKDLDIVSKRLFAALHELTLAVECECVPVRLVNPNPLYQNFSGDNHSLVTSQYIGQKGIYAFGKDYYNSEVIRFRFTQNNHMEEV